MGSRHGLWLGAACLLVLALGGWLAVRFGASPAPEAGSVERPPVKTVPPSEPLPVEPPPVVRREPPRPPKQEPPPAASGDVAETPAPPAPPPEEEVLADPFEPRGDQEAPIRTLVSVGDIQLGVIRESARIRDEAGLMKVLVRIGDDLEKRLGKPGAPDPQELLDGYREELGKYMDGMVELSGPGFRIGTEVGPPLPREQWWKPRAR
ncbi:hypothetical protein [Archangium lipolyticum]|uniref:hypothetical protein n=1 Tax=Archangium lipolyticum TaxID=2970465 RepID=UPI002149CF3A|nr:hypothetical protein [Archangium lipolyticum]